MLLLLILTSFGASGLIHEGTHNFIWAPLQNHPIVITDKTPDIRALRVNCDVARTHMAQTKGNLCIEVSKIRHIKTTKKREGYVRMRAEEGGG